MKKGQQIETEPTQIKEKKASQLPEYMGRTVQADILSRKLLRLLKKYPFLLDTDVDGLCKNTEINYIRSLLVLTQKSRFRRYYRKELGIVSEYINKPLTIKRNVKFCIAGEPENRMLTAKRVLIKRAFGTLTGLVISNDYGGLIIDYFGLPVHAHLPLKRPKANRIWAQKPITEFGGAYNLWFSANDRAHLDERLESELGILSREFPLEVLQEHINENSFHLDTNLDHLFFLLEEAGILIEEECFASSVQK